MCLLAAFLTDADVAILFDDDQVYDDPDYLKKAMEFIGGEHEGRFMSGMAGYYLNPDDSYLLPPAELEWQRKWGNREAMNEAFGIIGSEPRLKPTPFVFGGNMVIHRSLFEKDAVRSDRASRRGHRLSDERPLLRSRVPAGQSAVDHAICRRPNARRPGIQMRQDIIRFARERAKLATQHDDWVKRCSAPISIRIRGAFSRTIFTTS